MGRKVAVLTAAALALALAGCMSGTQPGVNEPAAGGDRAETAGAAAVEPNDGSSRVYAIPRENPTGHPQHESEQVFLRDVDGTWEVVEWGTGISCADSDLSSQLLQVCDGLGERERTG